MNTIEKKLHRHLLEIDLPQFTPGVVIEAYHKGKKKLHVEAGESYPLYDLASLTKILFSATALMRHFENHWEQLFASVQETLPWWKHARTRPCDLLSHSAGLEWWQPYYKKLSGPLDPKKRWHQLENLLKKVPITHAKKAVYSDLDLYLLGAFLQEQKNQSLFEIWQDLAEDLNFIKTHFNVGNRPKYRREDYAPTENCPWRGETLQGEVHDENAWALAGVAPHAGLFGPIDEVANWGLTLRKALKGGKTPFGDPLVVQEFTKRQLPKSIGDWGYGFMKPSAKGASCGPRFSKKSFGHTGFTGPSLWMDPTKDLLVVILSNRVHPTRENSRFPKELRPRIHTWICQLLDL
jgi:CubicO group peptidase (beta-lactamase class C family)